MRGETRGSGTQLRGPEVLLGWHLCRSKTASRRFESKKRPELQAFYQSPPKGPEKWCRVKIVKKCRNMFDAFWRFLTFFALRENCRKVSKNFLTIFADFLRFLTWPLSAGPLLQSADSKGLSPALSQNLSRPISNTERSFFFNRANLQASPRYGFVAP